MHIESVTPNRPRLSVMGSVAPVNMIRVGWRIIDEDDYAWNVKSITEETDVRVFHVTRRDGGEGRYGVIVHPRGASLPAGR